MWSIALLSGSATAFLMTPSPSRPAARLAVPRMMAADLQTWLETSAGVSPKFIGKVMDVCDEEMIGSVENLAVLNEAGMLDTVFKPVIASAIQQALTGTVAIRARHSALASPTPRCTSPSHGVRAGSSLLARRWLMTRRMPSSIDPMLKPKLKT